MVPTAELPKATEADEVPISRPVFALNFTAGMLSIRMVATRSNDDALVIGALFWRGAPARSMYGAWEEAQRPLDKQTGPELHLRHVQTERTCAAGM
eukprot:1073634-Rhodomonas_salina.2